MKRSSIRDDRPVETRSHGIDSRTIREVASSPRRRQGGKPGQQPGQNPNPRRPEQRTGQASRGIRVAPEAREAAAARLRAEREAAGPLPRLRLGWRTLWTDLRTFLTQLRQYLKLRRITVSIEKESIFRFLIVAALLVLFAIGQTTFAARFPLFGRTPDLMLAFVIAVAMSEGERWGAVTGLAAGLVIDALGAPTLAASALLYMPLGWVCGVLTENYFTNSAPVRAIYTLAAGVGRLLLTAFLLSRQGSGISAGAAMTDILLPEYASTALMAVLPHVLVWLCLRGFHKSRAERVR